jgi:predicted HTH transcriptional regulator
MRDEQQYWASLAHELRALPRETGWVEFKCNNADPREIGEYISALANTAALERKAHAYVLWGVEDATHELVGTSFEPGRKRVGNEEIENWLLRQLAPKISFRFISVTLNGLALILLEIDRAYRHPVRFAGEEFIRIGSYKKRLKDFQEKERDLWRILDATPFERLPAADKLPADDVLKLLDYPSYFDLIGRPLPDGRAAIMDALAADQLIASAGGGCWDVMNLGAILLAKRLSDFSGLQRKAVRVIVYKGKGRIQTLREQIGIRGYASGFEGLIGFINGLLPVNEVIGQALRSRPISWCKSTARRRLSCTVLSEPQRTGEWEQYR